MDKNIFIEKLFDLLREKLGEEVTITQRTIEKSNGISYEGFTIEKKTEYISPVVSIDNCYDDYSSGSSLDEIMKEIVHQYEESTRNNPFLSAQDIQNYEKIKDRLYMQVVNGKKDVKSAVGTVINETAISTASAITGDAIGGAATIAASTLLSGPAAPVVGVVGLAAGAGASKITDKAIRTGETTVLNTYNSGKKKKAKKKRR